jgi:hypothetical protein
MVRERECGHVDAPVLVDDVEGQRGAVALVQPVLGGGIEAGEESVDLVGRDGEVDLESTQSVYVSPQRQSYLPPNIIILPIYNLIHEFIIKETEHTSSGRPWMSVWAGPHLIPCGGGVGRQFNPDLRQK